MNMYWLALCALLSSYVSHASQNNLPSENNTPPTRFALSESEQGEHMIEPDEVFIHKKIAIRLLGQCARLYYTAPLGVGSNARQVPIIAQLQQNYARHDAKEKAEFVQRVGSIAQFMQNYMKTNLHPQQEKDS